MGRLIVTKYNHNIPDNKYIRKYFRNYYLQEVERYDLSGAVLADKDIITNNRLEYEDVFSFAASDFTIVIDRNELTNSVFNESNLENYTFGLEYAVDGRNVYVGQIVPENIEGDSSTDYFTIIARDWIKWLMERFASCMLPRKESMPYDIGEDDFTLERLFNIIFTDIPFLKGININVGSNDTRLKVAEYNRLTVYHFDGQINENYHLNFKVWVERMYNIGLLDERMRDLMYLRTDAEDTGLVSFYAPYAGQRIRALGNKYYQESRYLVPDVSLSIAGFLYRCQLEYGAYMWIDENGILRFETRNRLGAYSGPFIEDTEAVNLDDKVLIEVDGQGLSSQESFTQKISDYNSVLLDYYVFLRQDGTTTIYTSGYYILYLVNGAIEKRKITFSGVPFGYNPLDLRHPFYPLYSDENENITGFTYEDPSKAYKLVFNNARIDSIILESYKDVLVPHKKLVLPCDGDDYTLNLKCRYKGENYRTYNIKRNHTQKYSILELLNVV